MKSWATRAVLALAFFFTSAAHAAFGDPDCSFGVGSVQTLSSFGHAFSAVPEAGGTVLARVGFASTFGVPHRINSDGTAFQTFGGPSGSGGVDPIDVVQADGSILFVTGSDRSVGKLLGCARRRVR